MSKISFTKPADIWEEALPLGNGRIGAMVYGRTDDELIQLNEESIWPDGPVDRINPAALNSLPVIRDMIFEGRVSEAQEMMLRNMSGLPESTAPYQPLCDMHISLGETEPASVISDYTRVLDTRTALQTISYVYSRSSGEKISCKREMFISHPANVLVIRLSSDKPLSYRLNFDNPHRVSCTESLCTTGFPESKGLLCLGNLGKTGYADEDENSAGCDYGFGVICFPADGSGMVSIRDASVSVSDSCDFLCIFTAATDKFEHEGCLEEYIRETLLSASAGGYDGLLSDHIWDYRTLYETVRLEISEDQNSTEDSAVTDHGILAEIDVSHSQFLFDYGRYLLISSSRRGTLPANLQGIWNKDMNPAWGSKYTVNINAEMNYWPAESCGLSECHEPLFVLTKRAVVRGKETARRMYGCRGSVIHHNTDINGDTAPFDKWIPASFWVMGGAWLCTHLWNHYEYTLDTEFLKKSFPYMCETALFFLDFLIEKDGHLVTCPSVSPENTFIAPDGKACCITYGSTMDNQLLRDLLTQILHAAEILGAKNIADISLCCESTDCETQDLFSDLIEYGDSFLKDIKDTLDRLSPTRITGDGRIAEWIRDYDEAEPGHRHVSHLYGLYPSSQINACDTPELLDAACKTLEYRLSNGGGHTGWSRAWIIAFYAALGDGNEACDHINKLIRHSMYPNYFDAHPPFQIDGNFGVCAAISKMLVSSEVLYPSRTVRVRLLPALPDKWKSGSVKGLRIRGNASVSFDWSEGKLTSCTITAGSDFSGTISYGNSSCDITLRPGEKQTLNF